MGGTCCKAAIVISGTVVVVAFVYYDYHRHLDPNFKRKLKYRRNKERTVVENKIIPDPRCTYDLLQNPSDKETIILYEIGMAEELMEKKLYDKAAQCFANAACVCDDPRNILRSLRKTLPNPIFELLIHYFSRYDHKKFLNYPEFHDII